MVQANLGLLILLARTKPGSQAIITSNLSQMLWLPLSEIKPGTAHPALAADPWAPVYELSLRLAGCLLRSVGHEAFETCVDVVALMQDQLTGFLAALRTSVKPADLEMAVCTTSFISLFMAHHKKVSTAP